MDLDHWENRFVEFMQLRNWSPRTIASYGAELAPFFEFLREQGVHSLGEVTRGLVEDYRVHLFYSTYRGRARARAGQSLTLRTQSCRLSAVKAFLRFLHRQGYLLLDPAAGVDLPKIGRTLPQVLSEEETFRLLEGVDLAAPLGLRDRAILELLYGTALRNAELCGLRLETVDRVRRELRVLEGKNRRSRVVPLGEEALAWLSRYLDEQRPRLTRWGDPGWVFLSHRSRQLLRSSIGRVVHLAARRAGLEQRVFPHLLRHSCATHMLRRGAGVRHLQLLLGHATLGATQRYTHVEVSDLRRVLLHCHPREQP